jgi:hypothetical protein
MLGAEVSIEHGIDASSRRRGDQISFPGVRSSMTRAALQRLVCASCPLVVIGAILVGIGAAPASAASTAGFGQLSGPGGVFNGLTSPTAVAVSPDGSNVYVVSGTTGATVASSFGALAILKREPATGAISEVGCFSSDGTDGVDGASDVCTAIPSLLGADGVAVSPNGLSVFVTSSFSGAVVAFARNPSDGTLTRLGCFQARPVGGASGK